MRRETSTNLLSPVSCLLSPVSCLPLVIGQRRDGDLEERVQRECGDDRPHRLKVQVPFPARDVVSVADVAPRHGGLSAEVAMLSHWGPLSSAFAPRKSAACYNAGSGAQSPKFKIESSKFKVLGPQSKPKVESSRSKNPPLFFGICGGELGQRPSCKPLPCPIGNPSRNFSRTCEKLIVCADLGTLHCRGQGRFWSNANGCEQVAP